MVRELDQYRHVLEDITSDERVTASLTTEEYDQQAGFINITGTYILPEPHEQG